HRYAGMKQLYHFAQEVGRNDHQTQILLAGKADSVESMDEPPLGEIVEMAFSGPRLTAEVRQRVKHFAPDILHVWTPRFVPALAGWQLHRLTGARVIVDHEDDEEYHVVYMRRAWTQNWQKGWRRLAVPAIVARNSARPWFQPLGKNAEATRAAQEAFTYKRLTDAAVAHTAISPNLVAWARCRWPHKPVHLLYPGANLDLFAPAPPDPILQDELGLVDKSVLVYSGTMSLRIFEWFLQVLRHVKNQRNDIFMVLVGEDSFRNAAEKLAYDLDLGGAYRLIGQQSYSSVPSYLSLADIVIQHPIDQANELRLPAKLPEYLATGKPVVTFANGIGQSLQDGVHVRKLYTDQPSEAAHVVLELLDQPHQRDALGKAARNLARERYDWTINGERLVRIYAEVLKAP
ncbi:MAG: glycosyltransferase, partial [Anaerolineales bacterium]|nr:glycosyltransferase [Anaerolineales bacterium]